MTHRQVILIELTFIVGATLCMAAVAALALLAFGG